MPISETLVRDLCSRITSLPQGEKPSNMDNGLAWLGGRIAEIQRRTSPAAQLKGMACFAADPPGSSPGSQELRTWLEAVGPLQRLSAHCDVKWLVADVGLTEDFSNASFAPHVLPRLLKRISPDPSAAVWDAVQEGIRLACRMKGRGTDIFGAAFLTAFTLQPTDIQKAIDLRAWPIATAAGFLLAAADLQTPIVVSGAPILSAIQLACALVPAVADYVLLAQPADAPISLGFTPPLLTWTAPDPLAVILGLDLCQSAAKLLGN
ncbi:MAG: Phosphoribosyltransferase [Verrucomicrobiales bacterium]|nr:Phosphoribosyltransferase [Verrucomicrobiales bacterium]